MKVSSGVLAAGVGLMPVLVDGGLLSGLLHGLLRGSRVSHGDSKHRVPRSLNYPMLPDPYPYDFARADSFQTKQAPIQSYPYGTNPTQSIQAVVSKPNALLRFVVLPIRRVWQFVVRFSDVIFDNLVHLSLAGIGLPWILDSWKIMEWIINKISTGINEVAATPLKIPGISVIYRPIYYLIRFVANATAGVIIYPVKIAVQSTIYLVWLSVHIVGSVITIIWHVPFNIGLFFNKFVLTLFGAAQSQ